MGQGAQARAARAVEPARHPLDGPQRARRRHPRHRRTRLDRLQRLTRLRADAGPRRGVAVRARPGRHARRHSLGSSTPSHVSRITAPVSATTPATITRGWLDSRTVSTNARPSRISTAPTSPAPTISAGSKITKREKPEAARSSITMGSVPDALPAPDANYTSGDDYVVEFLGYRFSFGAQDFEGRVVAAAVKLGVVESPELDDDAVADLVTLAAQGSIDQPVSRLGRYLVRNW